MKMIYDGEMLYRMRSCSSVFEEGFVGIAPGLVLTSYTNREVGYCAGSHLELFWFGGDLSMFDEALTGRLRQEVTSLRITGGWYAASPIGKETSGNENGFCDFYMKDFAPDPFLTTLPNLPVFGRMVSPADGTAGALNLLVNWVTLKDIAINDDLRDGLPVVRVLAIMDTVIPTLSDSSVRQTLRHETPGHETPGHETPGHETPGHETPGHETPTQAQMPMDTLGCLRKHNNCLISPHAPRHTFHMDDGCVVTRPRNETLRALEEKLAAQLCPRKTSEVKENAGLLEALARTGYRYRAINALDEDAPRCPFPDPPTKAQFQQAMNVIRPHFLILTTTSTTNYTDAERARIDELAQLSGLPEDNIVVDPGAITGALYSIVDQMPTILCTEFEPIPTLAPQDDECGYCEERYYKRTYTCVLAGATAGTVLGATGFQLLQSGQVLDAAPELDDQLEPAARPRQLDPDHVLFAN
ncbi:hypothetical protein GNI_155720 [Gregarina niphandrodes]|uniref:Uncharacterized protein n=1 Tax=Gregarina niphandrodes TaxID=110365 RepID=A0A023AZ53_GRENI|nr:hypothetical protein GNI_155720 [Gregarina niphandrodes]EZG43930.1 hypothetical protein GNI_155720 [Gregarina niphandrodes]|eukprot:XP_011132901.1 hypothetical protein GNI_155720 [Gregarina niphandrodes]